MNEYLGLKISVRATFTFDNQPALRRVPLQSPAGEPSGMILAPREKLDRVLTVALVVSFQGARGHNPTAFDRRDADDLRFLPVMATGIHRAKVAGNPESKMAGVGIVGTSIGRPFLNPRRSRHRGSGQDSLWTRL